VDELFGGYSSSRSRDSERQREKRVEKHISFFRRDAVSPEQGGEEGGGEEGGPKVLREGGREGRISE